MYQPQNLDRPPSSKEFIEQLQSQIRERVQRSRECIEQSRQLSNVYAAMREATLLRCAEIRNLLKVQSTQLAALCHSSLRASTSSDPCQSEQSK